MEESELDQFMALSELLTGFPRLDPRIGLLYLARLKSAQEGGQLTAVLTLFSRIQKAGGDVGAEAGRRILMDPVLGPTAQQVLFLWYTSALLDEGGKIRSLGTPEEYFSGLVWSVVGAHPPGLSGGYFGHWRYPPEN